MEVSWLAPREREVANIVYARGEASAIDVCRDLSDPISNAAVRSMLMRLQAKGILRRRKRGNKYLYAPAATDRAAREAALRRVSREYFGGSLAETAAAVLELARSQRSARTGQRAGLAGESARASAIRAGPA